MRARSSVIVIALLAVGSSGLRAQTVVGRVTDRTTGFAIAGVVVSGIDANREMVARAVTDSASGYRLPVMPGMVALQFRRIGFSPLTVSLADSANGRIDVFLTRLPTVLPAVKAIVTAQCDAGANRDDVLALWDQARSGMLTSLVARQSPAAYASVLLYRVDYRGDDEVRRTVERIELPPGVTGAFIAGGEPAVLARDGYLDRTGFESVFVAPDDHVLSDESFLATHCFTLESTPASSDSIGIRFESGKGVKSVGIAGVVWMRRNPLDIISVEYSYTNVERALQRVKPGGSIRFRQMPNGITMIHAWRIRGGAAASPSSSSSMQRTRVGSGGVLTRARAPRGGRDPVVTVSETGAVIELMQWADVPTYVAPLGTVSGVVIDKATKKPLTNALLRFDGTPFKTVTDSTGAFTMHDVLPGLYAADVGDPELQFYGAEAPFIGPLAIRYGANTGLRLEAEGPAGTVFRGCDEKTDGRVVMPKAIGGPNAVFGRVVAGKLAAGELGFRAEVSPVGMTPGTQPFMLKGKTDKFGRFRLCGLPHGSVKIVTDLRKSWLGIAEVTLDPLNLYRLKTIQLAAPNPSPP